MRSGSPGRVPPPGPAEPLFLLGGSPLILLLDPATQTLQVGVEVTRGLTRAGTDDRFWLRTSAAFTKGTDPVASTNPKDQGVTSVKDAEVRGGGMVAFDIVLAIPTDDGTCLLGTNNVCQLSTWEKLVDADDSSATGGNNPDATVTVQLILIDAAGKEHVLDEVSETAPVDAKGNGGSEARRGRCVPRGLCAPRTRCPGCAGLGLGCGVTVGEVSHVPLTGFEAALSSGSVPGFRGAP